MRVMPLSALAAALLLLIASIVRSDAGDKPWLHPGVKAGEEIPGRGRLAARVAMRAHAGAENQSPSRQAITIPVR